VSAAAKPNIVFILADDLGYNELGFTNSTRGIITPNLDALAHQGVVMKNYYVQPICTPTRSALMTGRYTIRLGTQASVIYWDTPWAIPINETFLPQNMQDAGYNTAMFGKWHLGMFKEEYTPMGRGFEEHLGYYQGCGSAYTHVTSCCTAGSPDSDQNFVCAPGEWGKEDFRGLDWFRGNATSGGISLPDASGNHTNSCQLIRDAAVDYIERQKGAAKPFYLYLPFQNVHMPYTCDKKYREMYGYNESSQSASESSAFTAGEATLFGYITEMDDAVGDIVAALKRTGAYDNSVIIFSSDNGAPSDAPDVDHMEGPANPGWIARNYPFRGHKTQIWEGGTRVAGFVHSPSHLPASAAGTVSEGLFHVTDWLPTIVGLAGGTTARNFALDGKDIWPALSGGASPRTEMLYNVNPLCHTGQAGAPKAGLRMGDYKLLAYCYTVKGINGSAVTGPVNAPADAGKGIDPELQKGPLLYDLVADPREKSNVAAQHPDVMKKMLARLAELAETMALPMVWTRPFQGEDYFCKDCPLHPPGTGAVEPWGPWVK
jgi:arylsulfatase A-like enzyme